MYLSIIIPSYNGAHKLPNILESLAQQSFQDFELLVVLDGSTDSSVEIVEGFNNRFKDLRLIQRDNGGRAVVRNTGAREAKGDLLLFFDDDMRLSEPDLIQKHLQHHNQYAGSILVGNVPEDKAKMITDFQHYKEYLSRSWTRVGFKKLDRDSIFLTAAHFSIPKAVFEQLGGFDAALNDAEDFDFGVKAHLQKVDMYFDEHLVAWHDDFITAQSYVKRLKQYRKAHIKLRQIKPELYQEFDQYEYNQPTGIKKMIYWFFSFPFWLSLIDNGPNIFKILPKKIRYKIYPVITTAQSVHFPS